MGVPPYLWAARRNCFLVSFPGDEGAPSFSPCAMSELRVGDIYTLEASACKDNPDPLQGLVAVERMYRVVNAPYSVHGMCQVDSERI